MAENDWGLPTIKSYLRQSCLNTESVKEILECSKNVALGEEILEEDDDDRIQAWNELMNAEPSKYEPWKIPPIWETDLSLQQTAEPAMHQLFLGVTKTLILEVQNWCSLRGKYSALKRRLDQKCRMVMALHLSWCKTQPIFGENLGGWVAENCVGFARLTPWMYAELTELQQDSPFVTPERPISKWKAEECKAFLRERRLPRTGRVADLRKRVQDNKDSPVLPPLGGDFTNVRLATLSLWIMLCLLMGMRWATDKVVDTVEQLIRVFLTCCHDFDKEMLPDVKRKEPFWLTAYNFSCLLNIPEQILLLGPLRNRWEGSVRGEGFLRIVKPAIVAKRLNWAFNLMCSLMRQKCLLFLKRSGKCF